MHGGRAFLLDFDHTLFDTDRFFWVDVRAIFARFEIDARLWEESYALVWPAGYSLEKHLEHLVQAGQVEVSAKAAMKRVLQENFADLRSYLFPDVEPFLKRLQARGIPCFLLSFGDPAWQAYKVQGARIDSFFREVFYTPRQQTKAEVVEEMTRCFPEAAAVDNDPRELDLMKAGCPQLSTFWIKRVPPEAVESTDPQILERFREARGYAVLAAKFRHQCCQTLDEVPL
ncbi:MAG: HAD family hydrolase [Candidatus Methylomirabilales bacterium]